MEEFLVRELDYARQLYRDQSNGILRVSLETGRKSEPDDGHSAVVLVSESRPAESRQRTIELRSGAEEAIRLPAGDYWITVAAAGWQPFRTFERVTAGGLTSVNARLRKPAAAPPSFEEVLHKNGIRRDPASLRDLVVPAGETVVLDSANPDLTMDVESVQLETLADVKRVFGVPDVAFKGDHPRFGRFSPDRPANDSETSELGLAQRAALFEYVQGNSKSVSEWEMPLNRWIGSELISVAFWALRDIDVGPNAVLEVRDGGLICNTLRVHYSGLVRINSPGPVKVEMNAYERYGIRFVPLGHAGKELAAGIVSDE